MPEELYSKEQMEEALDAIHDVALKISDRDGLPREVSQGLDLIISIARYKTDVRANGERSS